MDIKKRSLEEDMVNSQEVISLLHDEEIARDFYRALSNVDWALIKSDKPEDIQIIDALKGEPPDTWSCSWRHAGGIVAEIRHTHYNTGENYMDYYSSGGEGTVSDLVREVFERLGWKVYSVYEP